MHSMHTQAPPNRLAELRKSRGVTLKEIGELCGGVYTSTVKRWESGEIPQKHMLPLAARLGVSAAYLAGWTDDERDAA